MGPKAACFRSDNFCIWWYFRCPHKGGYAIEEAVKCLARGENICIFPEGVLSTDGKIGEFRSGVARLHRASKCAVVPFAIYGGYDAWPM